MRERFPQAHASPPGETFPVLTPVECFTPDLFPEGALSEVIGTGLGMLVAHLLEREKGVDFPELVLVDSDCFDPASFSTDACSRLLWVRCATTGEMLKATDLLVRDGNIPFVLLDTCGIDSRELRRLPTAIWWRLKLAAETTNCRLVVLSLQPHVPCASLRIALEARLSLEDFDHPRRGLLERLEVTREKERRLG